MASSFSPLNPNFTSIVETARALIADNKIQEGAGVWMEFFGNNLLEASPENQITYCDALLKQLPDAFAGYYYRACAKMTLLDYQAALADLLVANDKKPFRVDVLYNIAVCQDQLNQTEQTIITCNQILELEPDHLGCLLLKGTCLGAVNNYAKALVIFAQVEQLLQESLDHQETLESALKLYFNRSQVKKQMGDIEGSEKDHEIFNQILSGSPSWEG